MKAFDRRRVLQAGSVLLGYTVHYPQAGGNAPAQVRPGPPWSQGEEALLQHPIWHPQQSCSATFAGDAVAAKPVERQLTQTSACSREAGKRHRCIKASPSEEWKEVKNIVHMVKGWTGHHVCCILGHTRKTGLFSRFSPDSVQIRASRA